MNAPIVRQPVMTPDEAFIFLESVFHQIRGKFEIEEITSMRSRMRMKIGDGQLRPGGTVSGPTMFELADCAFYVAIMGMIGKEALTVTTNATINFLNKPAPVDLICEARILKLGKLLATGDATIWSEGQDAPVAHATMTYAIPPKR
ncbi:MAG: PaaI family thioesterase [Paracoccaceae bacterium]|jgi:uncharacterized protein (TIGR00369 family)|nr:PaaI family thioesterase [Paracoccaceae bacterium]MDG1208870.1 PaaI family thioesterase [Paracoccaceae bacterium]MDG1369039.1 PaaI family thioesterase [Paracoccaceae bacterium]MDG1969811.1 PaaI family thioesterase [Paracoccaceae bacterium]